MNRFFLSLMFLVCCTHAVSAQTPLGRWITVDDKTGLKRAVVELYLVKQKLYGKIVDVYAKSSDAGVCSHCVGEFKDKRVKGLEFIWGLKNEGHGVWDGGYVLDAETGKIYRMRMRVKGDKLYVRGYVGLPVMGRTQIWIR